MRLDKYLTKCSSYSRKEAKKIIKNGVVVNSDIIKDVSYDVDEYNDKVFVNNELLNYNKYIYIMLNKPMGVITATEDSYQKTVLDLIKLEDKILKIFPVGRLDKDTEGLILLTNNGKLAHKLLSPKKDIYKKYYVEVDGELTEDIKEIFYKGVKIDNNYICKSSVLTILETNKNLSKAYMEIAEGKFHQIKKMMKSVSLNVVYLKRVSIGDLILDDKLNLSEYRYLTEEEIGKILNIKER